jgi:DNA-binding ferritin-like protein
MTLRDKMLYEQQTRALLEQVKSYAYEYADSVAERNVFPSQQALADLEQFINMAPLLPLPRLAVAILALLMVAFYRLLWRPSG